MADGETKQARTPPADIKFGRGFLHDIWYFAALSSDLKAGKLQRYELLRLPGPALKARYAYYVVHAEGQAPSPAARLFIDWLLEQAQDERTPIPALPDSLLGRMPTAG